LCSIAEALSLSEAPYKGLVVIELARVLAGPWIGQILADLGATVIKVESPEGDDTRHWGPPFLQDRDGQKADAAYFHSCNRGKRSIVADLKTESGRQLVHDLVGGADVFIENFKVGGLKQYGLDYATLSARHPKLVYCSVSGFGQDGPYAQRPGYDFLSQAMAGIMDLTGAADGEPQKMGVAFADIFTGLYGLIGIQAALAQREHTGTGQLIDISLLDSMVGVLANQAMNYLVSGTAPRRMGNVHPNICPYQTFATADEQIVIAVGTHDQFLKLCDVLGLTEIGAAERYASNELRVANRDALCDALQAALIEWPRASLLDALADVGVPAAPINSLAEVFADPQVQHRALQLQIPSAWAADGSIPGIRTPISFSDLDLDCGRPAPRLDEHREVILAELYGTDVDK
jgi:crotonobetainyl-CoA:carnitine CoA-transferase CaiB-like acyl-CoA transferase